MIDRRVNCDDSWRDIDDSDDDLNRMICPTINIFVVDEIQVREQIGLKVKDSRFTGKAKIRSEQLIGDDLHRDSGKFYKKVRVIDRENDKYLEMVSDPETGEVIHHCEEPLRDHFGHGSAKKPTASL